MNYRLLLILFLATSSLESLADPLGVWPPPGGVGTSVSSDEITSDGADEGNVLTATSAGGATWGTVTAAMVQALDTGGNFPDDDLESILAQLASATGGSYSDADLRITGSSDASKLIAFEADTNVPVSTTVTLTAPSASGTLALTSNISTIGSSGELDDGLATGITNGYVPTASSGAVVWAAQSGGGGSGPEVQSASVANEDIDAADSANPVYFTGLTFGSAFTQYTVVHVRAGIVITGKNASDQCRWQLWLGDAFLIDGAYATPTTTPGFIDIDLTFKVLSATGTDTADIWGTAHSTLASHDEGAIYAEASGDFDSTDTTPDIRLAMNYASGSASNTTRLVFFTATAYRP